MGDATNKGASIAIEAIGEANRASQVIDAYLNGREISYRRPFVSEREVTENLKAQLAGKPHAARIKMPQRSPEERRHDFQEINLALPRRMPAPRQPAVWSAAATTMPTVSSSAAPTSMRFTLSVWKVSSIRALWRKNWFALSVTRECILCNLCVRTCDEVAGKAILGLVGRGFQTVIRPEFNDPATIADCVNCRKCAEICPTGALRIVK